MASKILTRSNAIVTGQPVYKLNGNTVEVQLTVVGDVGATVSATAQIYGSNDGKGWIYLGDLVTSGTTTNTFFPSISDSITRGFALLRADINAISGSNAIAIVTQGA